METVPQHLYPLPETNTAVHLKKSYCHSALARERARADGMLDPGVVHSWIDMVNASQDNQSHWMTPIITTTPTPEQEFRWDFYDQQMVAHRREMASA
jgi:hypothetical protein